MPQPTRRRARPGAHWAGASLLALVTAGCAATPPNVDVEADWRDSIRNLGLFALYPLAEDIQPGDVFLHAPGRKDGRFDLTRITSLSRTQLLPHLKRQQDGRLVFAPAPAEPKPAAAVDKKDDKAAPPPRAPARPPAPRAADIGHAEDPAAALRLRRVAIPAFTAARLTQAQIGGGGTSGNVDFSAAFGAGSKVAVSVTLADLEELSVDAGRAMRMEWLYGPIALYRDMRPEMLLDYIQYADGNLLAPFCRGDWAALSGDKIAFVVANQVLYAHNIQYNFHDEASAAGALTAAIKAVATTVGVDAKDGDKEGATPPKPEGNATPPAPPAAPVAGNPGANAAALVAVAAQLSAQVKALEGLAPGTPGVTAKFGVGRLGTATLDFKYSRPMAVGIGAPRTVTIREVLTAQANIARGLYRIDDIDPLAPAAEHGEIATQILRLQAPMRRSFKAMLSACHGIINAPPQQLAAMLDPPVVAGQEGNGGPLARPAPGPSVRSLLRTSR
jgi:hypothetical protein